MTFLAGIGFGVLVGASVIFVVVGVRAFLRALARDDDE